MTQPQKIKRSLISKWRDQIIKDKLETINQPDAVKDAYAIGISVGIREMTATLSLQGIIKLIID